jgi:hypothetical protein
MGKLHKIESLKPINGVIERNHKLNDQIELYQKNSVLVTIHFFLCLSLKKLLRGYFSGAFNVLSLHKILQNLHKNNGLTFDYTLV